MMPVAGNNKGCIFPRVNMVINTHDTSVTGLGNEVLSVKRMSFIVQNLASIGSAWKELLN